VKSHDWTDSDSQIAIIRVLSRKYGSLKEGANSIDRLDLFEDLYGGMLEKIVIEETPSEGEVPIKE